MDKPDEFEGRITITWPAATHGVLLGWAACPYVDGRLLCNVTRFLVHCDAVDLIWAEVTMLTDEEGKPLYDGAICLKDGEPREGTFAFLVEGMGIGSPLPASFAARPGQASA